MLDAVLCQSLKLSADRRRRFGSILVVTLCLFSDCSVEVMIMGAAYH